ncbi:15357_t:CDS:1, partial [Racocetra persica]
ISAALSFGSKTTRCIPSRCKASLTTLETSLCKYISKSHYAISGAPTYLALRYCLISSGSYPNRIVVRSWLL